MNLNAYDNITESIDKTKTWIDVKKKLLLSREIKYRKYISIVKRYNNSSNTTNYYLALLDDIPNYKDYKVTTLDSYGRIKVRLNSIWRDTCLAQCNTNCNIMIKCVEADDTGNIYLLDI